MLQRQELVARFGFYTVLTALGLGFATTSAGCSGDDSGDDDESSGGTGGTGSGGGAGASADAVTWDATGWIQGDSNPFGIQGPWYAYNDCMDAMPIGLPCTVPEPTMIGPDSKPGWTAAADKICTKGVAAQVVDDPNTGMKAYSQQWGAGLAFDLASPGGTDPVKGTFDMMAAGIKGFSFDIVTNATPPAPPSLRVNFKSPVTGNDSHFVEVILPALANQAILLDDALQGDWVTAPQNIPKTAIESVQFQIFTNTAGTKAFDFCVSNMKVIK